MTPRLVLLAALTIGCGSSESDPPAGTPDASPDTAVVSDSGAPIDDTGTAADAPPVDAPVDAPGCTRAPRPEAAPRKVVVSHPFATGGKKTGAMEVLDLASDGTLTRGAKTFALAKAAFEPIAFTPDGEVGLVAEEDGTIGVFRLDDAGDVKVVHAGFKGSFYAGKIVVDPSGHRAFVVDSNTLENGGGIYVVNIACDGTLTDGGKLVAAKSWQVFAFLHGDKTRALVSGGPALGSTLDTHLLDWKAAPPKLLASTAPFPDADAIPSWLDVMPDDKVALVADNGIIKGSRVAVFSIEGAALKPLQVFPLDYPAAVIASPYGNAALVLNADGKDGFTLLKYNAAAPTAPFTNAGKLVYVHGKPELPYVAATIARGPLKGRVLVAENVAVRQLQFTTDGSVTDLSKLTYPSGLENIVGTIGVQP